MNGVHKHYYSLYLSALHHIPKWLDRQRREVSMDEIEEFLRSEKIELTGKQIDRAVMTLCNKWFLERVQQPGKTLYRSLTIYTTFQDILPLPNKIFKVSKKDYTYRMFGARDMTNYP